MDSIISLVFWISLLIAIAFCATRFLGWWGVPVGGFIVSVIYYVGTVQSVTAAMNEPDWDGTPDMDGIFMIGVLMGIVFINTCLLPVTAFGLWLRHRSRSQHMALLPRAIGGQLYAFRKLRLTPDSAQPPTPSERHSPNDPVS